MKNKINMFIWWSFLIIYLELIYRVFIIKDLFSFNTFYMIIFCIPIIFIFSLVTSLFSKKINKIINIVLSSFIIILYLAQIVYFNFYYSMFSFFSLLAGGTGQVMQFWTMILEVIIRIWYIFIIVLIPVLLAIKFRKKIFNYEKINVKYIKIPVLSLITSIIFITLIINFDNDLYSTRKVLFKTHAPMLTINKVGLLNTEIIDIYRYIFKFEEKININESNEKQYSSSEYNVLNIKFGNSNIDNYFKSIKPTNKNKYTGIFKDKNIIFINTESFDKILIDEKLTPTLYKLSNDGFKFTNYYQPLYPISTFDGEFMNLTSLIPKEGTWSLRMASDNSMPFEFGNVFKNIGYKTYAFHDHVYNFYDRDKVHPKLGFKYIACGNGLEKDMNCKNWPNSDYDMMKSSVKYYINEEKFAAYYMTVSGHLNYNFNENNISKKNKSLVENLKYSNKIKSYLATGIEVDKALESLLKDLEKNNKLEDTVIILTPDHYPYGLTCKELNEVDKNDRCDKFELYHTSLIIYNESIKGETITKKISGIDLLPTIYNLFGIDYDSRLLMGRDIFSDEEHIVILSDRSFITDYGTYDSLSKKFTPYKGKNISKNYVNEINKIVNDRFSISSLILTDNYYKSLELK